MITKQLEHFGACENLTLSGPAKELSPYVNRLLNYGIIANVPENYEPSTDNAVMVQSGADRMRRGFHAMALVSLQKLPRVCALYKGKEAGFNSVAAEFANAYIAEFREIPLNHRRNELEVYADRSQDAQDFGWSQTHDAI